MPNQRDEIPDREAPLDSWKEIAAYLQRDVTTAMRWEKSEELPVHRHRHGSRASVYAYRSELDAWKAARQPRAESSRPWARWGPALAGGLALVAVAAFLQWGPILNPPDPLAEAAEPSSRRLWTGEINDLGSGASTDGRLVVFTDWSTGDLAAIELATGRQRRLTNKGDWSQSRDFAQNTVISSDGQLIAFSWWHAKRQIYGLRVMATGETAEPRALYSNAEVPVIFAVGWSRDGKQLLGVCVRRDGVKQIVLLAADSGALRVV